jgi:hypothetical protein
MSIYDKGDSIFNDDALYDDIGIRRETHPRPVVGTGSSQVGPDSSTSVLGL